MWCVSVQLVPLGWQDNIEVIQTWIVMEKYRLTICGSHLDGMCVTRGGPRFDITQHYTCHGSCSDDTQNNNSYLLPIFNLNLIEHSFKQENVVINTA